MNDNICLPKNYFYVIFLVLFLFTIFQIWYHKSIIIKPKETIKKEIILPTELINEIQNRDNIIQSDNIVQNKDIIIQSRDNIVQNRDNLLPIKKYLENRDRSILYDPLTAPERRVPYEQYPYTIKNMINIPTRGYPDNYQMLGLLSRDSDEKILQLFGRPTFPGSNQFEYYATTEQYGFANKIPIHTRGQKEIEDGMMIHVPILDKQGEFKVKLYNYDTPRYNPFIV